MTIRCYNAVGPSCRSGRFFELVQQELHQPERSAFFERAIVLKRTLLCLLLFGATGCDPGRSGVVTETVGPWLKYKEYAPRVYVHMANGTHARLEKLGNPFFVLAFVPPPGENPDYLAPSLVALAEDFNLDSIAVIQVTQPTTACDLAKVGETIR